MSKEIKIGKNGLIYELIDEQNHYKLIEIKSPKSNTKFKYKIYYKKEVIDTWFSNVDLSNLSFEEVYESEEYERFNNLIDDFTPNRYGIGVPKYNTSHKPILNTSSSNYYNTFSSARPSGTDINVDEYCHSDTLVFHCADRSTEMLAQIYQGKGWDVIRDGSIKTEYINELIDKHDKIVMLGHGTPSGLINCQSYKGGQSSVISDLQVPHLKGKNMFVIWCMADAFFTRNHIGDGCFITGNIPSEVWECRAAGCGEISAQLMLENITYWSKLCADVVDRALAGDVRGAVNYVREKYIEKYGDHLVTIYNAERTKVQGDPTPDLSHLLRK
jgi:hypothetical protein